MLSANKSMFQCLDAQRYFSCSPVKGNASVPQLQIMGSASWLDGFPWGSRTTSIGMCTNFQYSRMYLIATRSTSEGWSTEYQGMMFRRSENAFSCIGLSGVDGSVIGSHRTSYSCLSDCCLWIKLRMWSSSRGSSRSEIRSSTYLSRSASTRSYENIYHAF